MPRAASPPFLLADRSSAPGALLALVLALVAWLASASGAWAADSGQEPPAVWRTPEPFHRVAARPAPTAEVGEPLVMSTPVPFGRSGPGEAPDGFQQINVIVMPDRTGGTYAIRTGDGRRQVEFSIVPVGAASVVALPTAEPSPVAPTPVPSATPVVPPVPTPAPSAPAPTALGFRAHAGLGVGGALLAESYAAGAVALVPTLVGKASLLGDYRLDSDWSVSAGFDYVGYTLVDTALADSEHHRDQFTLHAAVMHSWPLGLVRLDGGLGYWARQVSVANKLPPSLSTPFVSSTSQLFHGPILAGQATYPLVRGLELRARTTVLPYGFAGGDQAVQALQPLLGADLAPEIAWEPLADWELTAAYRYEILAASAAGYTHVEQGPALTLQGRF